MVPIGILSLFSLKAPKLMWSILCVGKLKAIFVDLWSVLPLMNLDTFSIDFFISDSYPYDTFLVNKYNKIVTEW